MRRRDFLGIVGGAALVPLAAGAQPLPVRRLGVLFVFGEDHSEVPALGEAPLGGLRATMWLPGSAKLTTTGTGI